MRKDKLLYLILPTLVMANSIQAKAPETNNANYVTVNPKDCASVGARQPMYNWVGLNQATVETVFSNNCSYPVKVTTNRPDHNQSIDLKNPVVVNLPSKSSSVKYLHGMGWYYSDYTFYPKFEKTPTIDYGLILYTESDWIGLPMEINASVSDISILSNITIESFQVTPGYIVTFYEDINYTGEAFVRDENSNGTDEMSGFSLKIGSIKIEKASILPAPKIAPPVRLEPVAAVFHERLNSNNLNVIADTPKFDAFGDSSDIRVNAGFIIQVYSDPDFMGESQILTEHSTATTLPEVRSVKITKNPFAFVQYTPEGYFNAISEDWAGNHAFFYFRGGNYKINEGYKVQFFNQLNFIGFSWIRSSEDMSDIPSGIGSYKIIERPAP